MEAAAIGLVERARIERALLALTEEQRIAITLMDIAGFTAAEVAAITASPRGTVLARVHRGRKALARLVGEEVRRREHEPEVAATIYLAGSLNAAERERFEGLLLACEECWQEVQSAHRGGRWRSRCVSGSGRRWRRRPARTDPADGRSPPMAGRRRRGRGHHPGPGRGRRPRRPAARRPNRPRSPAAVADYRTGVLDGSVASSAPPPVRQTGGLRWLGARQGRLAGLPVVLTTTGTRPAAG